MTLSVTAADGRKSIECDYVKGGAKPKILVTHGGIKLREGRDYTLAYSNNKGIGAASAGKKAPTITITGKGNYKEKVLVNYTINKRDFDEESGIRVFASDLIMPKTPSKYQTMIQVVDAEGSLLKAGVDYDKVIVYKKNGRVMDKTSTVSIGDMIIVEITGMGCYSGDTISSTYTILEPEKDISKATIKIKDQTYTGKAANINGSNQIVSAILGKSKKPIVLSVDGGKTGDFIAVSYVNNTSKGTAKVTFKGINGYGGYKTVTYKIGSKSIKGNLWHGFIK